MKQPPFFRRQPADGERLSIRWSAMALSLGVAFIPIALAKHDIGPSCREITPEADANAHSNDPNDSEQCVLLSRIYCDLADDRDAKVPKDLAIAHVSNWLADYRRAGSNVRPNYRKTLELAANFVYAHPELDTWAAYYHAGYRCVAARDKTVDFERFSTVQDSCEQMHPNDYEGDRDSAIAECYTKNLHLRTGRVIVGNTVVGPKP